MTFGFTWGYSIHSGATITWSKAWGNAADFRIEGCRIFSKLGYRGTPKNHLCNRIFHCKPSSYWRSPWLWKPPILYIVLNTLKGCCPCAWLVVPLYPAISAYETRCINKQTFWKMALASLAAWVATRRISIRCFRFFWMQSFSTAKWRGRTHQTTQAGVEFCCVRHKKGGGSMW